MLEEDKRVLKEGIFKEAIFVKYLPIITKIKTSLIETKEIFDFENYDDIEKFKKKFEELFEELWTPLHDDYEALKGKIQKYIISRVEKFQNEYFESEGTFKSLLYSPRNDFFKEWKTAKNEELFREEYLRALEKFKLNISQEFKNGNFRYLCSNNIDFIFEYTYIFNLEPLIRRHTELDNKKNIYLFHWFKKFYLEFEAIAFFAEIEAYEKNNELKNEIEKLKNQVETKTKKDLSDRFEPISRKARMEDIYYTRLKWKWIYAWLSIATVISLTLPLPIANPVEILVWLLIRLPFVIAFWVGLAFISKRQREAHNEYIYFTHLFHLLNGMISVSVRSSDEAVRQEFIRAGMSHLASSPLEGLYGKSDKSLEKTLSKINFNINKNL